MLKARFQAGRARGQWTGKVQSGRLLFKWNSPGASEREFGTGAMKLVNKDEAIVLGFPTTVRAQPTTTSRTLFEKLPLSVLSRVPRIHYANAHTDRPTYRAPPYW